MARAGRHEEMMLTPGAEMSGQVSGRGRFCRTGEPLSGVDDGPLVTAKRDVGEKNRAPAGAGALGVGRCRKSGVDQASW
jgi:hypothetical protein